MFANLRMLAACALLIPVAALACDDAISFSKLTVAPNPGVNAAAYPSFTSKEDDAIFAASSPCCKAVEIHTHETKDGVMQMRRLRSVKLKAGEPTAFQPGGLHLMLIGLKKPLAEGDKIPVTFRFQHAKEQTVSFTVGADGLHDEPVSPKHHH